MKNNTSQKIKTGIFVVAGVLLLLVIIFVIGNQQNLFRSTFKLHANYRSVVGLQEGAFVRFAGINVGTVDLIDIVNDTTVRVDMSVLKKVKPFLKTDSRASISSDGLMGDKLIQVSPGSNPSAAPIADGGQLVGVDPFDMDKVMARVDKVGSKIEGIVNNVDTLSSNLAGIFMKVNTGKGTLGKLLNSEKISSDIEKTIASAKKTAVTADKAAEGLKENMEAAKHNFLLRGYFKKKEKKRIKDSIDRVKAIEKAQEQKEENQQNQQKEQKKE